MDSITTHSLTHVRDLMARKELGVEEVTLACLERIHTTEPALHALLSTNAEAALEQARTMDRQGPRPDQPLWGVPLTIKDVLATADMPTTCASRILEGFRPPYDATAVARLRQAGAIFLGKTNMDEFAMGSSTENSAFGPTRNPWDLQRVPGGSSGGSAASVAAGQCFGSIGTDTGGSIRQPAAFCGIVGLKPTYGRVSRYGLIAYGSSLDQAGPMTRSVADAALLLEVIAGHDPKDSTSSSHPVARWTDALRGIDLRGMRVGMPQEYWGEGLSPEVEACCRHAVRYLQDAGAQIVPVSLPHTPYAIATYYIIAMAEASSNLARYDGVRYGFRHPEAKDLRAMYTLSRTYGFGEEVIRRILLGTYVLSAGYYDAYYKKAAQVRRRIRDDFLTALSTCDVLCAPACPTVAFRLGENTADPLQMYLTDIFTVSLNLSGLPGICVPAGIGNDSQMPVGVQFFGRAFDETSILRAAAVVESARGKLPLPSL
jgi:aspartyl-tRNA(Asn)/glutamyl-tRNA(Gln) amidotransferase subunit A